MNDWYNTVHVPDVTRAGILHNATRYFNPDATGTKDDPRYLSIYETDWQDLPRALAVNQDLSTTRFSNSSRLHPAMQVEKRLLFRRYCKNPIAFAGASTQGLLITMADCLDPEREAEFNWWYDYHRSFDLLLTSAACSASKYRNVETASNDAMYLALYETQEKAQDALREMRRCVDPAQAPAVGVTRYFAAFDLIFSESAAWSKNLA